ncbi:DNA processing protein DprA [Amylibacter marinus]|uniref:DNA processing protein DprA n=1 Tax=Amylibacter marinus TaxID=1475483 RepID=A0ABQ5VUL4_9RHOB|nr:DNA-processing protein DprA [Amylibacter marinus]GLQ34923.1 DNA processing protein DprA [Amylibacter marinus]
MMIDTPPKIPSHRLPHSQSEQVDWLRLCRSHRVGPATFVSLLDDYDSCGGALAALPEVARISGVKSYHPYDSHSAERELDLGYSLGYRPLFLGASDYPALLAQASDAPAFLWARGDIALAARPCVSVIGARNASSLGLRMASRVAYALGEIGYVVVSGLARGIDTVAHQKSIATGTIAVQAGGLDVVYPKENADLQEQIGTEGLCLSEHPIGLVPQARHFPQRNRIVAGLSLGVVVIEAAARSGSLITARAAMDQGREVLAVPGSPIDPRASGCNILIRDGATLVRDGADIDRALGQPCGQPRRSSALADVSDQKSEPASSEQIPSSEAIDAQILDLLSANATPEDLVIRDMGFPAAVVSRQLTALEMSGKIQRQAGGILALVN